MRGWQFRRYWRFWTLLLIAAICLVVVSRRLVATRDTLVLSNAIEDAGGFVTFDHLILSEASVLQLNRVGLVLCIPDSVHIESGSHPIPDEIRLVKRLRSIRSLHLKTNAMTDACIPLLSGLNHVESIDLSGSDVSEEGVARLLESSPRLRKVVIDSRWISVEEYERLNSRFPARINYRRETGNKL